MAHIRDGTRAEDNLTRAVELTRPSLYNTAAATGSTMSYRISAASTIVLARSVEAASWELISAVTAPTPT